MSINVLHVGGRGAVPAPARKVRRGGTAGYSVRPLKIKPPRPALAISPEDKALFSAISDPANARLFSAEAASAAFAGVEI